MRCMIVLALLAFCVAGMADTETTKTATVTLTIERYVALEGLEDVALLVAQEDAPGFDSVGGEQTVSVWKNCDVDLTLSITDLYPNEALLEKEPTAMPLPAESVSINGESFRGNVGTQTQEWVWCTENDGEDVTLDYWWERNGLCDHAGTYEGLITVTLFGIDP